MQTFNPVSQGLITHPLVVVNNPNSKSFDQHLREILESKPQSAGGLTLQDLAIKWPTKIDWSQMMVMKMSIAESMSMGFTMKDGKWTYDEKAADPASLVIDQKLNAPKNAEDAMRVVRLEAQIRLSEEYLTATSQYVKQNLTPPLEYDKAAQCKALADSGFDYDQKSID